MPRVSRRHVLRLGGAAGVVGITAALPAGLTGCSGAARETAPLRRVRIGLLVPSTGGYKPIGDEMRAGYRQYLAVTDGTLGGHPVETSEEDEGVSPESALAGLERLLARRVDAVVGVASSDALMELSPVAEAELLPLLSANASPHDLQGTPYVWRTSHVNPEPGLALARHLAPRIGRGPVALVAQDDRFGRDTVAGLREGFAEVQAADLLAAPVFTPHETQPGRDFFAAALAEVAELAPEAVFAGYAGMAATAFLRQYLAAGLEPDRLYGAADLTEGDAVAALGEAAIGVRTAANYAAELRGPTNRTFAVTYRASGGTPTTYAVAAYDAAAALDTAVRLTGGNPVRRQINLMLGEVGMLDSPRGRWQFNQGRTPTQKWYLREVGRDGPVVANMVLKELGTLG